MNNQAEKLSLENEIKPFVRVRIQEHLTKLLNTDETEKSFKILESLNHLYLILKTLEKHTYNLADLKKKKAEFEFTQNFKNVLWVQ